MSQVLREMTRKKEKKRKKEKEGGGCKVKGGGGEGEEGKREGKPEKSEIFEVYAPNKVSIPTYLP